MMVSVRGHGFGEGRDAADGRRRDRRDDGKRVSGLSSGWDAGGVLLAHAAGWQSGRAEECRAANAAWAAELAHRRALERRFEPTLDPCPVHGVGRSRLDEQLDAACNDSLWDGEFPARGPLWKLIAELDADRS